MASYTRRWLHDNPLYAGIILIILGIIFFLDEFGFKLDIGKLWPLLLIVLGVLVLLGYKKQGDKKDT